ncbi:MFS transporter [Thiomicrorhabdus sediminis]|uniref:MFS transporter n=1 Tax=Thiomicrorhabdus sediminis TaxID=2580412 RepID=A0A4P9K6P4_9GAMM|nr:MFS transporter [Thiomicrorhabdus sediminis]QCU89907.1 MFS transporter [Thiomicrorhabdus sediminis]
MRPIANHFSYALLAMPIAMLGLPVYIYLPSFYNQQFSLSLTAIGSALLLARILDVFTDPLIGYWSDKFRVKFDRIKQIFIASILLLISLLFLFQPTLISESNPSWILIFALSFISYFFWTLVQIPYLALAAEISPADNSATGRNIENRQNPLISARESLSIIGVMAMLLLPFLLQTEVTEQRFYNSFWLILVAIFMFSLLLLITQRAKLQPSPPTDHKAHSFFQQWQIIRCHHSFALKIFKPYFLNNLANAIPATLFIIFVDQYLQLKDQVGVFLLVYFLTGLLALPVWLYLARRFGNIKIWRLSIALSAMSFLAVFALDEANETLYLIICVLTGLSLVVDIAIPASIQTDISRQVSQRSENLNGFLFGIWGMTTKLSLAVAIGFSLPALDGLNWLGIEPDTGLLLLYALPAIVLKTWVLHILKTRIFLQF